MRFLLALIAIVITSCGKNPTPQIANEKVSPQLPKYEKTPEVPELKVHLSERQHQRFHFFAVRDGVDKKKLFSLPKTVRIAKSPTTQREPMISIYKGKKDFILQCTLDLTPPLDWLEDLGNEARSQGFTPYPYAPIAENSRVILTCDECKAEPSSLLSTFWSNHFSTIKWPLRYAEQFDTALDTQGSLDSILKAEIKLELDLDWLKPEDKKLTIGVRLDCLKRDGEQILWSDEQGC